MIAPITRLHYQPVRQPNDGDRDKEMNTTEMIEKIAEKDFEVAVGLSPLSGNANFNLGQLYELTGRKNEALKMYIEASKYVSSIYDVLSIKKINCRLQGNWDNMKEWI